MRIGEILVDTHVVDQRLEILLHDPVAVRLNEIVGTQRSAAHRGDGSANDSTERARRHGPARGDEPVRIRIALHVCEAVAKREAAADVELEAAAGDVAVLAATAAEVEGLRLAR